MRTLIIIVAGLLLMALAMWLAKPAKRTRVAGFFTAAWLMVTLWNLFTGMSHGYSLQEELPIQLLIFSIPVIGTCNHPHLHWNCAWPLKQCPLT